MLTIDDFVAALTLEVVGDDRFRAANVDPGHGVTNPTTHAHPRRSQGDS